MPKIDLEQQPAEGAGFAHDIANLAANSLSQQSRTQAQANSETSFTPTSPERPKFRNPLLLYPQLYLQEDDPDEDDPEFARFNAIFGNLPLSSRTFEEIMAEPDNIPASKHSAIEDDFESAELTAAKVYEEEIQKPNSIESIYWRYKYNRRVYRLNHSGSEVSDAEYRSRMSLSKSLYRDPTTAGLGSCYSRPFDRFAKKSSPWTQPEMTAYWDEFEAGQTWYKLHGQKIDVGVSAKGQPLGFLHGGLGQTNLQFAVWEAHIEYDYQQMRADHEEMMADETYRRLVKDEIEEDKEALDWALRLQNAPKGPKRKRDKVEDSPSEEIVDYDHVPSAPLREEAAIKQPTTLPTRRRSYGQIVSSLALRPRGQLEPSASSTKSPVGRYPPRKRLKNN
jgi:hypothetical protein